MGKQKRNILISMGIIIVVLLMFLSNIVGLALDVQWFKEVGYLSVFTKRIGAQLVFLIPTFIIFYVAIYLYYKGLKKSLIKSRKVMLHEPMKEKLEKRVVLVLAFFISLIVAISTSSSFWYETLQYANATSFNTADPIFNLDISFYMFKLPLIKSAFIAAINLLVVLTFITIALFIINGVSFSIEKILSMFMKRGASNVFENISVEKIRGALSGFAGKQLAILSSVALLMVSIGYLIKGYELVYSTRGVVFGASYTDIHVSLNFFRVIAVVSLIASIVIFLSILASKVRPIVISIALIFVLIIIEGVFSLVAENLIVKSNQRELESPYIKYNMEYTKKAFGLDGLSTENYKVNKDLTAKDITDNKEVIDNVKINSYLPSKEVYNQVQSLKYFYNFNDVDIDRYNIDGKYTQVFISARELNTDTLQGNVNTWQGKHLLYTHGYGVVMSKVSSITSSGKPDFVMKDIPENNISGIKLDNARIYFGEKTTDYAIVNTTLGEVDYSEGGENSTRKFDADTGIQMSFFNKALLALKEGNLKILLSQDIKADSKILINREIVSRVNKIAPFLTYDKDPYIVINNGKLFWIIDGYTTSNKYPFSEPVNGYNYIRNSVKVVVDAYSGKTDFYIADNKDPIINTYSKIFKGLFKDISEMDKGLVAHLRYAEDLFDAQCNVLGKYHVTDPNVLFDGSDLWQIAKSQKAVDSKTDVRESDYLTMKLPGSNKQEMLATTYFNVRNKENMSAMIVGRMDGENYGKLAIYKFPSDTNVYSSNLFQQSMNQNTVISKEITLLNSNGSKIEYGDVAIIPIKESLLYVMPLYVRATGENSIPEVKKVIIKNGERIVMGADMEEAIRAMFSISPDANKTSNTTPPAAGTVTSNNSVSDAKDIYTKMIEAQKSGDWTTYGENLKKLGDILNNIKQ